jgi:hypothetical protein
VEKHPSQDKKAALDPFQMRIQEELEEFLQDLALEQPFINIFETLRRWDFQDRYGPKVIPLPKKNSKETEGAEVRELMDRVDHFLIDLEKNFGMDYSKFIRESFRYYTQTTSE